MSVDLPVVRVLPSDLLRVLGGYEVTVYEARLRLFTAEEWLPLQHAACDDAGLPQNKVDLARAQELTRPPLRGTS